MLLLMYLIIGTVVCGSNYFVLQDRKNKSYFDESDYTISSIAIGVFWPICIGVVAARVYQYIQKYK